MAKPLGAKSVLIRDAIKANPKLGNKDLASKIMDSNDRLDDKIKVTPADIAQQKQAMKKPGSTPAAKAEPSTPPAKRGRPKGSSGRPKQVAAAPALQAPGSPVDLLDGVLSLARQSGGIGQLKRLVDRLAEM